MGNESYCRDCRCENLASKIESFMKETLGESSHMQPSLSSLSNQRSYREAAHAKS